MTDRGVDAEKTRKRLESQTVNRYLGAIQNGGPPKPMTEKERKEKIDRLGDRIDLATENEKWLTVLRMTEEQGRLFDANPERDLESEFVAVALSYAERNDISWYAWRQLGVPSAVLKSAGVPQTRVAKSVNG